MSGRSGAWALFLHSIKRVRSLVLVMGLILAGFQVLLVLVARSLQRSGGFDRLSTLIPDFVRQLMGPSFAGILSFKGVVCVGYFHVAVMAALVGLAVAVGTELASEIEMRFMDLILARPLARHWVITRSAAKVFTSTLFLLGMIVLGTWAGLAALAPAEAAWPSPGLVASMALNLGALVLAWGCISLAIASASRRRSAAGSLAGLLALATFLLDYVARVWEPAEAIAWLSLFRYYSPLELIMGDPVSAHHLAVLGGIALAGCALAYVTFQVRDV